MSISLRKDPAKRLGGWALIMLPAGADGAATVEIGRGDTGEHLGPHGWQGGRHAFGPYEVETAASGSFLRVGPEIVNQIDAYQPLSLSMAELGLSADLTWPEDILPAPGEMGGGGMGARPAAALSGSGGAQKPPPPPPAPEPPKHDAGVLPVTKPGLTEIDPGAQEPERKPRRGVFILLALLAAALCAAALWWFVLRPQPAAPAPVPAVVSVPENPVPARACVRDDVAAALRAESPDPADLWTWVELCRSAGDLDLEVRVLERLVALEDARALRRFAQWYDPAENAAAGPFGAPDAANAAQYYKRAIAAGSQDAGDDLAALCTHLRGSADGMSRAVVAIHCE